MSGPPADVAAPPRPQIQRRRGGGKGWALAAVVVVILLALVGIGVAEHWFGGGTSSANGCPTGETLQGNGASFIATLAATWTAHYQSADANTVNYVAGGSGTGITDLTDKTVDFAATDDPLSPSQRAALPSPVLTLPIAGGALAIVYNVPGVPTGLHLSGAVLANIYLGSVTSWNDPSIAALNPGVSLPSFSIESVYRADAAGTTFVLTDYLSQESATWAAGPGKGISVNFPKTGDDAAVKTNSGLLQYVQTTNDTLGYVDLTDVLTASAMTPMAAMENPSGAFILANLSNTASAIADRSATTTFPTATGDWWNVSMVNAPGAGDYPLATFAYFYAYQAAEAGFAPTPSKSVALEQWLSWAIHEGQADTTPLDYVALAAPIVSLDDAGLATMTYNGSPLPSCG